ncbi:hypothetical protein MMC07_000881 [Pseudocyphellaria aurata]|nr:hypothetical protein [Pseudocyphellaria aurata]
MLGSLIRRPSFSNPEAEDIFSSALNVIFPEDVTVLHGDPGFSVIYKSKRYGDLELRLAEPQTEDERKLFGQYLWNAGVLLAEYISGLDGEKPSMESGKWVVKDEKVLELGAGTGLAGIVSVLAGAGHAVISDFPAPELLANISVNAKRIIPVQLLEKVAVEGHEWGAVQDEFSSRHAHYFTRVLSADCLWSSGQHHNLAQSMLHFLSFDATARVWVVAGFHTGRAKVASFLDVAIEAGLEIEEIWERDVNGGEREWIQERGSGSEDVTERKKWLVVAILRRKLSRFQ